MTELKPCPFCGGEAHVVETIHGKTLPWVRCKDCGMETPMLDTEEEAIEAWNRRVDNETD